MHILFMVCWPHDPYVTVWGKFITLEYSVTCLSTLRNLFEKPENFFVLKMGGIECKISKFVLGLP